MLSAQDCKGRLHFLASCIKQLYCMADWYKRLQVPDLKPNAPGMAVPFQQQQTMRPVWKAVARPCHCTPCIMPT